MRSGLQCLIDDDFSLLKDKKVGLLCHAASVTDDLSHIVDIFLDEQRVEVSALFGPQHGFYGQTQDNMIEWQSHRHPDYDLPLYSLYGQNRKPTPENLSGIDVLVCDLQDIGARYYTFVHTLALCMEACEEQKKAVVVLDRPNPIDGVTLEGPVLDTRFRSFVGLYPVPVRHAMTIGELATSINHEIQCELTVVKMDGWQRETCFEQTGLPWIMPSPNIPAVETAIVYPGCCLLEGTNVSEGRGTTRPFELSGAPWVDAFKLRDKLDALELPGAVFRPVRFIPTFHKWASETISGVQIHVTDRSRYRTFRTGLALVLLYREMGGSRFEWKPPPYEYEYEKLPFDILCGSDRVRRMIEDGAGLDEIESSWAGELVRFETVRKENLMYV